jgi:hypothetical protein
MDGNETPITSESPRPRPRKLHGALENVTLALEEHVVWRLSDGARSLVRLLRRSFDDLGWALQRSLLWPAQDRFEGLDGRRRGILAGGGLAVIAISVTGLLLATSAGPGSSTAAPVAAVDRPIVKTAPAPAPAPKKRAPTLHGAAPVFKPVKPKPDDSKVGGAKPLGSSAASSSETTSTTSSAATAKISSDPSSSAAASSSSTGQLTQVDGPPAGKEAIAVAHRFSNAFVVFETGGDETLVRKAFAVSATPALSKSLLKRPPRLPADVKVPKAKVLNVVAGPSHGGVYDLSVSLLRVGVTSELRLQMEKLKGEGWRVTNVLG